MLALAIAATAEAGGTAKLEGTITADGSNAVGPWTTTAAETYRKVQRTSESPSLGHPARRSSPSASAGFARGDKLATTW